MKEYLSLEEKALKLRRDVLNLSLSMNEGHLGGSFSIIEVLISLYDRVLKEDDKFILSKGHCSFPYYLLLRERGLNPHISTHPERDDKNGIYCTTGSLGHGLPNGVGISLGKKLSNQKGKTYVLMSDGECQEGTTWESLMIASHHKLDNIVAIIDRNKIQALDKTESVLSLENLREKFSAFGTYVQEINGHDYGEIINSLLNSYKEKPSVIIANTIKGKGLSFMENDAKWHTRLPSEEELIIAHREIGFVRK